MATLTNVTPVRHQAAFSQKCLETRSHGRTAQLPVRHRRVMRSTCQTVTRQQHPINLPSRPSRAQVRCQAIAKKSGQSDEVSDEERAAMDREAALMAEQYLSSLPSYLDEEEDEQTLRLFEGEDDEDYDEIGGGGGGLFDAALEELEYEEAGEEGGVAEQTPSSPAKLRQRNQKWLSSVPTHLLPKVAVIGRPNVGKSALFNRLSGTQGAIVYDTPGVTRDRLYVRAFWGAREFLLIDTGGLIKPSQMQKQGIVLPEHDEDPGTEASAERIPGMIERQAAAGVEEADAVVVVMDGQAGPCASDSDIVTWLRKTYPEKPVVLAVNKCESPTQGPIQVCSFWEFGHEPIGISALSGTGTGELLDQLMDKLPEEKESGDAALDSGLGYQEEDPVKVAILGRPNVGKSSLLNAIVGEERTIVSRMSGTTRDSIDTTFTDASGQKYVLVDTAGIRKRASVAAKNDGAEQLSVKAALKAVARADVAVLVLDAMQGPTEQDFRLAERVALDGRACVLVLNKWDLVPDKETNTMVQYQRNLVQRMRNIDWAPSVFISATEGQRVERVLEAVKAVASEHRRRITTATLNMVLTDAAIIRAPPVVGGKRGRIYYGTQAATRPPTFVLFVNDTKLFSETYRRFIERQLREQIGFEGTPVRTLWRGKPARSKKSVWVKGSEDYI